jgi:prepilin-type N-terminal cleavage/methylation domain-containing protein
MKIKKLRNINKEFSQHKKNGSFFCAGFTLIETLVYIAIFSIFIGSLVSFLNLMTTSRINNQITLEINNQGNDLIRIITQSIRNADSINSPSISNTSSSLELLTSNPTTSTTVFSESGGILYMTEGTESPIALNNNNVNISNLVFSNLSRSGTSGSIQVRFTLSSMISNSSTISGSVNFYGSGTIKK